MPENNLYISYISEANNDASSPPVPALISNTAERLSATSLHSSVIKYSLLYVN